VSLDECCFVYITDSVIVTGYSVFFIRVHAPVVRHVLLMQAFASYWLYVAASACVIPIQYHIDITGTLLTVAKQKYYLIFLSIVKWFVILCNILLGFTHCLC
jgi:hypothetical protein